MHRRLLPVALAVAASLTLTALPASARPVVLPTVLGLPDGFQPEGIAIAGTTAYFGSRATGDIRAVDLVTGRGRALAAGPGTPSLGLKVDGAGGLWVAGGTGGDARVISTRTGATLASYRFAESDTFVNDVVLTRGGAWFTDSRKAVLYRVDGGRASTLALTGVPIVAGGTNLNGIVESPDGRSLLAVNSANGTLYRIDPATGAATAVDLGGEVLTNGDGLWREGRTLYVAQNRLNTVAEFTLSRDGRAGVLQGKVTSPAFDVPTTIAAFGNRLYLPNARFTTPPTPQTTYTASAIRKP
ncbi:SMP-30/gluconolactonase/LRE family protein [Actinokineospora bangkokensis]|uniref:Superoxide dismutase n=1 Tax=Actinokineospora bangkokensis TaxID=1193682 RepID=A0A1Q9LIW6_9PSEU|nr:superoxide dismutase [Actinokineospora bangkokensis]OLR91966.1 superoxide dismutase [Actinokineospora bangkokensis]